MILEIHKGMDFCSYKLDYSDLISQKKIQCGDKRSKIFIMEKIKRPDLLFFYLGRKLYWIMIIQNLYKKYVFNTAQLQSYQFVIVK